MVAYKAAAIASLLAGAASAAVTNAQTSLRILYQNNLNQTDDVNHISVIMLDPMKQVDADNACANINENLLNKLNIMANKQDLLPQFSYVEMAGYTPMAASQSFWIQDNMVLTATQGGNSFQFGKATDFQGQMLPVLCTNTYNGNNPGGYGPPQAGSGVTVNAAMSNQYTGFRNKKAFRFLGIRYVCLNERSSNGCKLIYIRLKTLVDLSTLPSTTPRTRTSRLKHLVLNAFSSMAVDQKTYVIVFLQLILDGS